MSFKDLIHFQTDGEGTAGGLNPPSAESRFITHRHSKENPEKMQQENQAHQKINNPQNSTKCHWITCVEFGA